MYTLSQNSYFLHFRCFTGRLKGTCHVINKSRAHFKYVQAHVCFLNQFGRCQNTCSSNAIAGSSSPISHCECLLRTQRSCRRAACHAGPTCPVQVVSTFVHRMLERFLSCALNYTLHLHLSSVSAGNSCWCSWSRCTHLGLESHVEESRRDGDHVGEGQEGGASGPAEVFVSLDVHV